MKKLFVFLLIITTTIGVFSQENDSRKLYSSDNGIVKFISDAPLELISAESNELKGLIDPLNRTFAFQLFTQSLTGFNSPLQQEHFYENYIETEKFPVASFSGKIIENIDFDITGVVKIRAKGILDIHGVKKERIIKCDFDIRENKIIAISTFTVNLDDHNINIPKLVYQKIAEDIEITVEIELAIKEKVGE